ncbi:MAG: 5-aminolevulic acid synthase [Paracoccaceae bacterium]|nr:5-aminolevulic acid synthase [Paracoccaceae bacterium]
MRVFLSTLMAVFAASALAAEPVTGRVATGLLFEPGTSRVITSSRLDSRGQAMIRVMVPLMEQQLGRKLDYYGAIAMSPDEGFQSDASQSALNYHSVAAADAAALAACNANRRSGTRPCILAARIVPESYAERPLTLSTNATAAVREVYARARSPKAVAASASTGAYGVGRPDAALATCRRGAAGANDCEIVIAD